MHQHVKKKFIQYQDLMSNLFPELHEDSNELDNSERKLTRTITFQVTDKCNLACSYCYQINKGVRRMSFETAKKYIDLLLSGEKGFHEYVNPELSPGIILEFIGGEPFLEIELIDKICNYFITRCIETRHPWATKTCISICSNGVLYFDEKVQKFLNKYKEMLSFSITIDGNKDLHDACRVFPDGSGSYDIAVKAAKDWISRKNYMGSKITIAPGNVEYLYDAIVHMVELDYEDINANVVYEKGWTLEHAKIYYEQLKKVSDYFIDNNLIQKISLSLFNDNSFRPKAPDDLTNWCGGTGTMLSCDPDGYLYPCIRYMESSLGCDQKPFRIGDLENGIGQTKCHHDCIKCLHAVNRKTQSTEKCFNCPIAEGCSWCSAYNYQEFGTPDKRATYICDMHKARSLANVYFWNKLFLKNESNLIFKMYCPKEWALDIISEEEYEMLLSLTGR